VNLWSSCDIPISTRRELCDEEVEDAAVEVDVEDQLDRGSVGGVPASLGLLLDLPHSALLIAVLVLEVLEVLVHKVLVHEPADHIIVGGVGIEQSIRQVHIHMNNSDSL